MKSFIKRLDLTVERVTLRFFSSWLLLTLLMLHTLPDMKTVGFTSVKFASDINLPMYFLTLISIFLILSVIDYVLKSINSDAWLLLFSMVSIAFTTAAKNNDFYYVALILIPIAVVLAWLVHTEKLKIQGLTGEHGIIDAIFPTNRAKRNANNVLAIIGLIILFLVFVIFVGTIGVLRYRTYSAPNFDFGIFVNMFHNMKTTLLPTVSCERDVIMSHFEVHISPIWYLLLPFYALFPTPETLQIGQAVILASGVFPLYLICRKYSFSRKMSLLVSLIYTFLPAVSSGTFYDIHENCFLTPLLLWLFYFFEAEKPIPMYIFAALTLTVKEDAAVYVAIFALYAFFGRKKRLHGGIMIALSVLYISIAVAILNSAGFGAMTNRYSNYSDGEPGLLPIILTCIKNPSYVFSQLAQQGSGGSVILGKILYILQMLLPLGFIPVITKKISRYILLFPMILINLMTMYPYQYQIGYQYSFGTAAFLTYLFILNVSDMKLDGKRIAVLFCAIASALTFTVSCLPTYNRYNDAWQKDKDKFNTMDQILDTVDPNASVTASTMLLPHLADRSEIYEVHYHKIGTPDCTYTDYVIIDMRYANGATFSEKYMDLGIYEIYRDYDGLIRILALKNFNSSRFDNP